MTIRSRGAPWPGLWSVSQSNARWLLVACVSFTLALRIVYCSTVELLPEETYYWNWAFASHLDIGYFDHPPMVAWLIRSCTYVLGNTEIGVRCAALFCSLVTSIFVFGLTRNLFGTTAARFALLLAQILPFFFLSGVLMTPDAPLSATWAGSLFFFERALIGGKRRAWAAVGVCLGLGLLSKYTIALLGIAVAIFMLVDPESRRWFRRWEPYAAVLLALALFSPVILWNVQHQWASFAFQTVHRLADRPQFALHKLIAASLIVLTPTGILATYLALARPVPVFAQTPPLAQSSALNPRRQWLYLRFATCVPLLVFAAFSLRHEVKLDWTGVVWLAVLPAIAACKVAADQGLRASGTRVLNWVWPPTLGFLVIAYSIGAYALATGVPSASLAKQPELVPIGWRDLASHVNEIARATKTHDGADVLVVGMDRYAIASELTFYSPDQLRAQRRTTAAHLFGGVGLMYELWLPASSVVGRDLLLVAWKQRDVDDPKLSAYARELEPLKVGTVSRDGKPVRPFYYRVLRSYRDAATPQG